ncbi:hypothetical protein MPSEU_000777300 [Mayamaea pseudoterrestris]|nr:hypothetical protein MPSEU_000777300 [Mayamaea pseudoterrestris]
MDTWVLGQISFWFTVKEIKPAQVVDKVIEIWLDLVTPGRGAGERNWFHRAYRTVEQSTTRASRELDIRRELRDWDSSYPEIHHELIVRWIVGALVSITVTSVYNSIKRTMMGGGGYRRDPYNRF